MTTVGSLRASIQGSALLIALPQILTLLQADFRTLIWVLLGYLLLTTALMPVIGRLADMFGRKNLYGSGFAVFTLGSFLSGLSQPQFHGRYLVGYRLVRGIGGSLLFTNSAAIVTDAFRTGRVGLGLVVGGTLTSFSWSWILMVNVPLGIFGTLWGMRRLRGPVSLPKAQQFDWMGLLTFTLGLGSLLLVVSLIAFPLIDTVYIYLLFGLAVLGLGAFFIVELGVKQPLLDFRLFEDKLSAYASLASA